MKHLLPLLLILLSTYTKSFATIIVTVNGQVSGSTFEQGSNFSFNISGLSNGASVDNQLWIDKNSNGIIEPGTDLLFVSFNQTDGVNDDNQGPGDQDLTANGTITTSIGGLSFPAGHYIFKSTSGANSGMATYILTAISSPTFYVSGKVSVGATGVADVVIRLKDRSSDEEYYALTDVNGNYIVDTKVVSGTEVKLEVPNESFNAAFNSYIPSPLDTTLILSANVTNVNFTFSAAKIITGHVTDTLNNPIADMAVSVNGQNGNGGYNGRTDINGNYFIAVDTGTYTIQFGQDQEPKGYLRTYYSQVYLFQQSTQVHVTPSTDTVKNINAVLHNGALIMGTFKKNGASVRGGVNASVYNVPGPPVYEGFHDNTQNFYYLFVPPGTYTIQFQEENGIPPGLIYNQSPIWPGTPVTLNSLSDTAKNINVDFTSPLTYIFTGNGNWSDPLNWQDNLKPPLVLLPPDNILINHPPGQQSILNYTQHVANGATLTVPSGKHLVVPGSLTVQ